MGERILELDRQLLLALNGDGGIFLDNVMWIFSSKLIFIPVGLLAIFLFYKVMPVKRLLLTIVFIALIVLIADPVSGLFKHYTPKFRPTHEPLLEGMVHTVRGYVGGLYGTVSAHAANSFGVALFSSLVLRKRWFTWFIFIFSAVVAYSRIYLGVHYPLDIFFGTLLGLLTGFLCYRLYLKCCEKLNL